MTRRPTRPRSVTYHARRLHRYLGLFIGGQFVLWTVGGLYFSWTNLDAVHGDHLRREAPMLPADAPLASPAALVTAIRTREPVDSLAALELVTVLGRPAYRVTYFTHGADGGAEKKVQLGDAVTGALRPPLGRDDAVALAEAAFAAPAPVRSVELLTAAAMSGHHEYREQPLPAWAVSFDHPSRPTVYVAAELGQVQRIRHDQWRVFDFLWMLHTMDYAGRDNFNNLALRAFSVLGLVTVASGFVLFALTSRTVRARVGARGRRGAGALPGRAA